MSEKVYAVLLAGGSGSRMGAPVNKVLLPVAGIPCIARSAAALSPFVDRIVLVCRPQDREDLERALARVNLSAPVLFAPGGATRQQSVQNGLKALAACESENVPVLIHDGARCLVDAETVRRVLDSVRSCGSGAAALPVTDTLRRADSSGRAGDTVPRDGLYAMQTPQGFRLYDLLSALEKAQQDGFEGTDDVQVMQHAGRPVRLTPGHRNNLKLTHREDLRMAEQLLQAAEFPPFRVGQGYDVHRLVPERKLILCGVEVPHTLGLLGHSDADVAVHALMDALLGAAAMGDIGRHFPDTDPRYEGADSMRLLDEVMRMLTESGFRPVNVDLTIVAQKPKLAPHLPQMRQNLAKALNLPLDQVNLKATTTERLGFEGRMEGISAQAVCLICRAQTGE